MLLIDTAGRLHNKGALMEELAKIIRVIRKQDPTAPHSTLLVLDATTGQNAMEQVRVFKELVDVTGLVVTKLDGSARGGIVVALAQAFGLPVHAVGVGEKADDLRPFAAMDFARGLVGGGDPRSSSRKAKAHLGRIIARRALLLVLHARGICGGVLRQPDQAGDTDHQPEPQRKSQRDRVERGRLASTRFLVFRSDCRMPLPLHSHCSGRGTRPTQAGSAVTGLWTGCPTAARTACEG